MGADCPTNATALLTEVATNTSGPELSWACDHFIGTAPLVCSAELSLCCAGQTIYVLCYGVTSAAYVLLTTLVLADLLGADKFTNSFGLLLLFQGVATLVGPPIVGYMFDSSGSYDSGFVLMGAVIALSGVMLYPIPCIKVMFDGQSFGSWFN